MGPGCEHSHQAVKDIRLAFFLNLSFTVLEIFGGLWTNSVAILADAVHDLGDSLSLGSSWYLERKSHNPGDTRYTYGYRRFSLLGALINAIVLIAGSFFVLLETIPRIFNPEQSDAQGMIMFAAIGVIVNGLAVLRLRGHSSVNTSAVAWHLVEDVLGWIAVMIVAIILMFTDLHVLDPVLSVAITMYVLYNIVRNLRKSLRVFLQAAPESIDISHLERMLTAVSNVVDTHHTHVWSLDGKRHVMTTHIVVEGLHNSEQTALVKREIRLVAQKVGIWHSTIEIEQESEDCESRTC
jgi:cobalt-zinc-cadmium efflux system protein